MPWYVRSGEKVVGPVSDDQLRQLAQQRRISPETEISRDNQTWVKARQLKGLFPASPSSPPPPEAPPPRSTRRARVSEESYPDDEDIDDYDDVPRRRRRPSRPSRGGGHEEENQTPFTLGLISTIIGVPSLVGTLIGGLCCLGWVFIPVSAISLLIGGIGLFMAMARSSRDKNLYMSITGTAVSLIAVVIAVIWTFVVFAPVAGTIQEAQEQAEKRAEERKRLEKVIAEKTAPREVATVDGVRVQVTKTEYVRRDFYLQIKVKVENRSNKAITFRGWNSTPRPDGIGTPQVELREDDDRAAMHWEAGLPGDPTDQPVGVARLQPGESVEDTVVFAKRRRTVKQLILQLPASNIGGEGLIKFWIPATMLQEME